MPFFRRIQTTSIIDPQARLRWGVMAGGLGIALNALLFAAKLTAGLMSSSVAMVGDALNNLSDAGASVVTLAGFYLAGREADAEHPFGHGRMEYVAGLIVALSILLMGFEVGRSSLQALFAQSETDYSLLAVMILAASVLVKLGMFAFQRTLGRRMDSEAMTAAAADSLSDAAATSVVLLCGLAGEFFAVRLDGLAGLLVSALILKAGWEAAKNTLNPLLGRGMDRALAEGIDSLVAQYPCVLGVHDFLYHDYGPGRAMLSFHAEVAADGDLLEIHAQIDRLEREIKLRYHMQTVIHMDPVQGDAQTLALRDQVSAIVQGVDPSLHIHELRLSRDEQGPALVFDLVVPYGFRQSDEALCTTLAEQIKALPGQFHSVIHVQRPYLEYDTPEH